MSLDKLKKSIDNTFFKVTVPYAATYTTAAPVYVNKVGSRIFKQDPNSPTTICIPIKRMLEIYEMGYTIRVCADSDVAIIHNLIQDYVGELRHAASHSVNVFMEKETLGRYISFLEAVSPNRKVMIADQLPNPFYSISDDWMAISRPNNSINSSPKDSIYDVFSSYPVGIV